MDNSKNNLILGISLGVAIISLAGFLIMATAYFEKSRELADFQSGKDTAGEIVEDEISGPVEIKVSDSDWIRGDKDAKITVVEFSDLECPFCARFHETMKEVVGKDPDVRWVFKHFPLPSHTLARKAAIASEAAGEQGKFWEYTDALYANMDKYSNEYFSELAGDLGLDIKKFEAALDSEKLADRVDADQAQGVSAGVRPTPTFFVNGQKYEGAYPYEDMRKIIDDLKTE